jgi:hypothetical protein
LQKLAAPCSKFLLAYLEPEQTHPFITQHAWEGAEPRLRVSSSGEIGSGG